MPNADFFGRLGLFVVPDFLEPDFCQRYLLEAQSCHCSLAQLRRNGGVITDESHRRTQQLQVAPSTIQEIKARLRGVMPQVASHFQLTLQELEPPSFYRYQVGDFFGVHRDVVEPDLPGSRFEKNRQISLILFLNGFAEVPSSTTFGGGTLTLYGLMGDPRSQNYGFPLEPEQGLLIGFPSQTWHEVKPVTHGERFTIVSWFI